MNFQEQCDLSYKWDRAGQIVRTKKGAAFTGQVISTYHNSVMEHIGCVVMAIDKQFAGCVHVYPITQLEEVNNEDT